MTSLTLQSKLSASCRSATSSRNVGYYEAVIRSTTGASQALQGALAQPTNSFKAEIFAAARAPAIYEMLQGTNAGKSRGWMYHIEGASSYLNAYPRLDVCSFIHQMSFHFRETICISDALKPEIYSISTHPGGGDGFLTDLGPYLWSTIAHNDLSSENTSSVQ